MKKVMETLAEILQSLYSFVVFSLAAMLGLCALAVAITWFFLAAAVSIINSFRGRTCKK